MIDLGDAAEGGLEGGLDPTPAHQSSPPSTRKRKGTSPTQRTLAELRKRGWIAQVVEKWNPHAHVRVDLFGVIDLVAIRPTTEGEPSAIVGIQACAGGGGDHAERRKKILAEPRAAAWCGAGCELEVWSWGKRGPAGKRKLWTLRVETYAEMSGKPSIRADDRRAVQMLTSQLAASRTARDQMLDALIDATTSFAAIGAARNDAATIAARARLAQSIDQAALLVEKYGGGL